MTARPSAARLAQTLSALLVASALAAPAPSLAQTAPAGGKSAKEQTANPCGPGNPCGPAKKKKKKKGSDNPCAPGNPCAPVKN